MNFNQFKSKFKLSDSELFSEFYDLFTETIDIKNKNIAVEKLKIIIKATFKLSASQSFANMSLRQLSDETQISMGGLYAYIKNKEQLSLYIHQFLNHFAEKTMNAVNKVSNRPNLENIIRTHIYLSEIMQPWFFFAFMESKNLNKAQRKYAIQSELLVEKIIMDAIIEGQKLNIFNTVLSSETIAAHIKPLLHDWYLKRWKYKQRNIGIEDFCFSVMIFINHGLTITQPKKRDR